jgi:FKBP-type peptidyl-prolyl cis-trans isomerase
MLTDQLLLLWAAMELVKPPITQGSSPQVIAQTPPPVVAPVSVVYQDIVIGKNDPPSAGDRVTVHVDVKDSESGEEYISSRKRGLPFTFVFQSEKELLSDLMRGMRTGGYRTATVPAEALNSYPGFAAFIPAGKTTTFELRLVRIVRVKAGGR